MTGVRCLAGHTQIGKVLKHAIAETKANDTVVIMIDDENILVQGLAVARVDEVMALKGNDIPALREALMSQNNRALDRGTSVDGGGREVTIMGDRDIPYRLLKKVMATCTGSEFGQISLAVMQKSSDKLDVLQASR